jgi:hypothetical protein
MSDANDGKDKFIEFDILLKGTIMLAIHIPMRK